MANEFLPFCGNDLGTNLLTNAEYLAATNRVDGNQPGVASGKLNNKVLRQSSFVAAALAQLLGDKTGADILDDANSARLIAQMDAVMGDYSPTITSYTANATHNWTYLFFCASANATAGATYTHNGVTYTVGLTIAAGTVLRASGNGAPLASGTLTKATGTGDTTITFYAMRARVYAKVIVVGGGGGGGGAAATGAGASSCGSGGGAGGVSIRTIRASLLGATETVTVGAAGTAGPIATNGGAGGNSAFGTLATANGGAGGSGNGTSGVILGSLSPGGVGGTAANGDINLNGGDGGATIFGNGTFGTIPYGGGNALAQQRLGSNNPGNAGYAPGGGGSGASRSASLAGAVGGAGAVGLVYVEEHYQ